MVGWIDVDVIKRSFWERNENEMDEEGEYVFDDILEGNGRQSNEKFKDMKNIDQNKKLSVEDDGLE